MIQKLFIQNFKSIKSLQLDCKRINLFIGEPNVGKSNILEAIGFQSFQLTQSIEGIVRANDLSNLFFENDPSNKITIATDNHRTEITYENGQVFIRYFESEKLEREHQGGFTTKSFSSQGAPWDFGIHPYHFKAINTFPLLYRDFLAVPHGQNLFFLLQTNKELRNLVGDIIQERGFKLSLRQANYEIEISKEKEGLLVAYPYNLISDTMQRIVFFVAAIESNKKDATLIFEEPESNVFPYYTKYLAEKISFKEDQQFFITTHNPYFLQAIIQKSAIDDLNVIIVSMDSNHQTTIRKIDSKEEIEELIDLDSNVFLNLDKFLQE